MFEKEKAVHAAYKHLREKVCFFKGKPLHVSMICIRKGPKLNNAMLVQLQYYYSAWYSDF